IPPKSHEPIAVPLGPLNAKSTRVQWSLTGVRSSWTDNGIYGSPVVLVRLSFASLRSAQDKPSSPRFHNDRQARNVPVLLQYGFGARIQFTTNFEAAIMAKIVHF